MLTVTVDLVPGGIHARRRTVATMHIANVSGLSDVSDYDVNVLEGSNPPDGHQAAQRILRRPGPRQTCFGMVAGRQSRGGGAEGRIRRTLRPKTGASGMAWSGKS
jgi:hypothetical protein